MSAQSENKIELEKLADQLSRAAKNAHFAGAYTLTQVAKFCREAVREKVKDVFTLRNKWTQQSAQITSADYRDDSPFSEVFVRDKYLADQEEGATRRLDSDQAVPLPFLFSETRATNAKPIPRNLRASTLARSGKGVVRKARSGKAFVFVQKKPVYLLQDTDLGTPESYKVEKKPFFANTVQAEYSRTIDTEYEKAFQKYVVDNLGK